MTAPTVAHPSQKKNKPSCNQQKKTTQYAANVF